ncbi:phosphate transporter PHO1 homolog 1 [Olea europaea subsp. europaea]|uniref:Phosphate transporter PHO1 homolog 1 n=2 Tax=Olea europaea subsp. europaea TaxID=158383 RepID=A0A8S0R907_OLEEU|nr:phosphate transporter PHO1 homolog 1 [Olea europaea subsp. europaea]
MVRFSKQLDGQLVPEWKEAFVNYRQLKKELKKMHLFKNENIRRNEQKHAVSNTLLSFLRKYTFLGYARREHRIIQVCRKPAASASKGDLYETKLLQEFADTDAAIEFFACLDLQLNKVNQFYRTKEREFLERGDLLKKRMAILIKLKTGLKQQGKGSSSPDSENDSISDYESIKDRAHSEHVVKIQVRDKAPENKTDELAKNEMEFAESLKSVEMENSIKMKNEDEKLRCLPYRLFNYHLINQSSKNCSHEGNKLHINKRKLHHAEKIIRGAFIELYKGLTYLKTYRNLNMLAFLKILKKFDKVTRKQVHPIYFRVIESSYFYSSDKVNSVFNTSSCRSNSFLY